MLSTSTAPCNSHEIVTGGGYERDQAANVVKESASGNAWAVTAIPSGNVMIQAFCRMSKISTMSIKSYGEPLHHI